MILTASGLGSNRMLLLLVPSRTTMCSHCQDPPAGTVADSVCNSMKDEVKLENEGNNERRPMDPSVLLQRFCKHCLDCLIR